MLPLTKYCMQHPESCPFQTGVGSFFHKPAAPIAVDSIGPEVVMFVTPVDLLSVYGGILRVGSGRTQVFNVFISVEQRKQACLVAHDDWFSLTRRRER